jgi:hypothetical protein
MHTNWLIGTFFLMIIASLISGIIELQYLGGNADVVAVFEQIFNPGAVSSGTVLGINIGFISTSIAFITGLWRAFWFDYAFFTGAYGIIRIFFIAINLGVIVSLAMDLRRTS